MALSGDLEDIDLKMLLGLIKDTSGNGKLVVKSKSSEITVYFRNGHPVNAEGDKTPIGSCEKLINFSEGTFEFFKLDKVESSAQINEIKKTFLKIDEIREEWKNFKQKFPFSSIVFNITEAPGEVDVSHEEWSVLLVLRSTRELAGITKSSPFGELYTLKILSSLFDKKLLSISLGD